MLFENLKRSANTHLRDLAMVTMWHNNKTLLNFGFSVHTLYNWLLKWEKYIYLLFLMANKINVLATSVQFLA